MQLRLQRGGDSRPVECLCALCVCVTMVTHSVTGSVPMPILTGISLWAQPQPVYLIFNYYDINNPNKLIKNTKHNGKISIKFLYTQ